MPNQNPAVNTAGPIAMATVITPSLKASIDLYTQGLGWVVRETGAQALENWVDRPEGFTGDAAEVGPPNGAFLSSGVRLIESVGAEPIEPLHTVGWSALEVSVIDVEEATKKAELAGWRVLFRPVTLGGGKFPLIAAQLAGPSGEGVYLTQILGELAGFDLPTPAVEVDGIFICVLGSENLESNRQAIEEGTGGERVSDRELPVKVVNSQYGFPPETLHRISSVHLGGKTAIEVDQLPREATLRERKEGQMPAGIVSVDVWDSRAESAVTIPLQGGAALNLIPLI